jgi:HSP20 family protein
MKSRDPFDAMWAEALDMLEQAQRLRRRFFQPRGRTQKPVWEPPMDVFETDNALYIQIALPGAQPNTVSVVIDGGALLVEAERPLPLPSLPPPYDQARVRHLEIPYGRFERHIDLPAGLFELAERTLVNGCLQLTLRKLR